MGTMANGHPIAAPAPPPAQPATRGGCTAASCCDQGRMRARFSSGVDPCGRGTPPRSRARAASGSHPDTWLPWLPPPATPRWSCSACTTPSCSEQPATRSGCGSPPTAKSSPHRATPGSPWQPGTRAYLSAGLPGLLVQGDASGAGAERVADRVRDVEGVAAAFAPQVNRVAGSAIASVLPAAETADTGEAQVVDGVRDGRRTSVGTSRRGIYRSRNLPSTRTSPSS